ncbi:hypothetical protein C0989_000636 [Termitomyces sp. Mn162]|nr:hypothetical protein C0989_000636 [Termitomyces sp. Mn162]
MAVSVIPTDGHSHIVQVYSDITAEWTSGDDTKVVNWTTSTTTDVVTHQIQLEYPSPFSEVDNHAEWAMLLDSRVQRDAQKISTDYAAVVALSLRQAIGATEITISRSSDGSWNTSDVLVFQKGHLPNRTNLAIKGIIGIKAMSLITGILGYEDKSSTYSVGQSHQTSYGCVLLILA